MFGGGENKIIFTITVKHKYFNTLDVFSGHLDIPCDQPCQCHYAADAIDSQSSPMERSDSLVEDNPSTQFLHLINMCLRQQNKR